MSDGDGDEWGEDTMVRMMRMMATMTMDNESPGENKFRSFEGGAEHAKFDMPIHKKKRKFE
jgi:hypothetical protein